MTVCRFSSVPADEVTMTYRRTFPLWRSSLPPSSQRWWMKASIRMRPSYAHATPLRRLINGLSSLKWLGTLSPSWRRSHKHVYVEVFLAEMEQNEPLVIMEPPPTAPSYFVRTKWVKVCVRDRHTLPSWAAKWMRILKSERASFVSPKPKSHVPPFFPELPKIDVFNDIIFKLLLSADKPLFALLGQKKQHSQVQSIRRRMLMSLYVHAWR